jgi:RNA polymerase sigma-70 factor (sigma-E family)
MASATRPAPTLTRPAASPRSTRHTRWASFASRSSCLGERTAAEDVVQDAFFGLYRHWDRLTDPANALNYARSAVLNGCRNALRVRGRPGRLEAVAVAGESAESAALVGEEHQEVLTAIRALPDRQREALVLRYYVDMSEEEIARAMGISRGTVKSTTSRAVAALARMLKEDP